MKYRVSVLNKEFEVEVEEVDKDTFEVTVNGKRFIIRFYQNRY